MTRKVITMSIQPGSIAGRHDFASRVVRQDFSHSLERNLVYAATSINRLWRLTDTLQGAPQKAGEPSPGMFGECDMIAPS
jgi:hypothetical protein